MGVYFQVASQSVVVSRLMVADCSLGIFPMIIGPKAVEHKYKAKSVHITVNEMIIIGAKQKCCH